MLLKINPVESSYFIYFHLHTICIPCEDGFPIFCHILIQWHVIFISYLLHLYSCAVATIPALSISLLYLLWQILVDGTSAGAGASAIIISVFVTASSWLVSSSSIGADSVGAEIFIDTSSMFGLSISILSSNYWTVWCWQVLP